MLETRYVRTAFEAAATTYQLPFFSTSPYGSSTRSTSRGASHRRYSTLIRRSCSTASASGASCGESSASAYQAGMSR
jgi:hypothetical protein